MKQIGEGEFGVIYSAIWKSSGPLAMMKRKIGRLGQFYEGFYRIENINVAVKILNRSDNNTMNEFFE